MKPLFIISCPIDTYSGYGARSRDIVKAIIELDKYDVKVLPQRWGATPWGFIDNHPEWHFLQPHILPPGNHLPAKPKIWAQISVPNEFQPVGEYNIGFTAGIETTLCDGTWIEGLNRMDVNFVSSNHAKNIFKDLRFKKQDAQGNDLGDLFVKKPIEVLFEGIDLTKYFPSKEKSIINLNEVKESFAYLFVGHWMQGDLGEDRKNVGMLVKTFYETFKDTKDAPALILKSSGAGASYLDRESILDKIHQIRNTVKAKTFPNIYLLHGEFTDKEINDLYNHKKIKAMVSLTKGEGFGRPLLEFSLVNKPIITTNWSGHLDFLDPKFTTLLPGKLTNVHSSAAVKGILLEEGQWFSVDVSSAAQSLMNMFKNYKAYEKGAKLQYHRNKNKFSFDGMKTEIDTFLSAYVPEFPSAVKLNLPNINLAKTKENVKLPSFVKK